MLLREVEILNLGSDGETETRNASKYLELVKSDQKLIHKVGDFLENLKSNRDLQGELYELKKIRYQKAHILAQKQLATTFIALKNVQNLAKKVLPPTKDSISFHPLSECIKVYCSIDIDYSKIIESIPTDVEQTQEVLKTDGKLGGTVEDLKNVHSSTHKKVREILILNGEKLLESFGLPKKKKISEVSLSEENTQKLKTLISRLVEFTVVEEKLGAQLGLESSQIDIISQVYMKERLKSLDFHFLSQTELNTVDKPEWMANFIEEVLFANISFLLTLNLNKKIVNTLVNSFLGAFYTKFQQRFQQDSNFFLEHEFLFTNFLCCLNEHSYRVTKFLGENGIELENKEIYDLTQIYKGKTEYLQKMISGELREFKERIFDKIDQMEIVTKDIKDKQKFDIALAETLENFVLIYAKNLKKYNATSTEFVSQFVRENLLDKVIDSLVENLKTVIQDTESASLAARFYIMDSIVSVSEYTLNQLKTLEEFQKADVDPGYNEKFESIKTFVNETIMSNLDEFWKKTVKSLRGFLRSRSVLNSFSSLDNINENELLEKDLIPEVKKEMKEYIETLGAKLQEPLASTLLNKLLDLLNQYVIDKILKEYKFSLVGLRFVKSFTLTLCEAIKNVRPQLYTNQEKKMEEMIKYLKCDKNVQVQLCQKLNSIEESTIPEDTKAIRKQTAIQNFGYPHLKPSEVLALYETQTLL